MLTYSTKQCFYEISIIGSSINLSNYDLIAHTYNNNICGEGDYIVDKNNYFVSVQGKDTYIDNGITFTSPGTENYPYYVSSENLQYLTDSEIIKLKPKFILQNRFNNSILNLTGGIQNFSDNTLFTISLSTDGVHQHGS